MRAMRSRFEIVFNKVSYDVVCLFFAGGALFNNNGSDAPYVFSKQSSSIDSSSS